MYMQGMATGGITMVANGNVGIGTTNPGYTLDVSAGTTTASVNMTSWPRTAANTLIVVGNVGFTGSVANWSNASTSMSTSLLTFVASNATTGGYFTILKSGIWSVKCVMTNNDINGRASIDASTNISNTANFPFGAIAQTTSGYWGDLNYTGYLSSNATMYYKVMSIGNPSPSVGKAVKLIVTFISEMPDITPVFPLI